VNLSQRAGLGTTYHFFIEKFVAESGSRNHISLFYRWICRRERISKPHITFLSLNLSQRAGLGTTYHFFNTEFVAESHSRNHISLFYRKICRREPFSEPHITILSKNLSQRAILGTTYHFLIEKFVAESGSRNHISLFYRWICRRERVSEPHITFLSKNLSQRAILETTYHYFIEKFVAESRSRNHISLFYRKICRREPFSKPYFTFLSVNLSQRAILETTYHYFIEKFVAESQSRNHISLFYRKICRREPVSEPHITILSKNLSQRAILEATFHFFIAEFVAESWSRNHISLFYRWICRREPISEPHFTFLLENLSQRAILEATFHIFIEKFVAESRSRNHIFLFYWKICRREPFSKPHFTFLSMNLSQRTGLETTSHFFIAEFVAESRSRSHISLFYCKICRRERASCLMDSLCVLFVKISSLTVKTTRML